MTPKLFVANWKMNKSFDQEVEFCIQNLDSLQQLSTEQNVELVICPSLPSLFSVATQLTDTMVGIGAQQCSAYQHGAYTGQVSAQSLKEVGCGYCIVGHSEQRARGVSNQEVAQQTQRLFEQNIHPIICIGENKNEYDQNMVFDILQAQLDPITSVIASFKNPYTIAYEPIWSIGTGLVPDNDYLQKVYAWLGKQLQADPPTQSGRLIYGGSVDDNSIQNIIKVAEIGGFLVGGASLDFQKFQKIVLLGK